MASRRATRRGRRRSIGTRGRRRAPTRSCGACACGSAAGCSRCSRMLWLTPAQGLVHRL
jgi:hypothetical protein